MFAFSIVTIIYFSGTEFIPSIVFANTVNKFSQILTDIEHGRNPHDPRRALPP